MTGYLSNGIYTKLFTANRNQNHFSAFCMTSDIFFNPKPFVDILPVCIGHNKRFYE